jgi:hypothetical protein
LEEKKIQKHFLKAKTNAGCPEIFVDLLKIGYFS